MSKFNRKEIPLYVLMCEKASYQVLSSVFKEKALSLLFLHSLYENSNFSFRTIVKELSLDSFYKEEYGFKPKTFGHKTNNELIAYIEAKLDELDKESPLEAYSHVFQLFTLQWNNNDKENWGLRGHPGLFSAMAREVSHLKTNDLSKEDFSALYFNSYEKITGKKLELGDPFYVPLLDPGFGGMSAGGVDPSWFIDMHSKLLSRLEEVQNTRE